MRQNLTSGEHDTAQSSPPKQDADSLGVSTSPTGRGSRGKATILSPTSLETGITAAQWSRRAKLPRSSEQEAARAETKARNAAAKIEFAASKETQKTSSTQKVVPHAEHAIVEEGLLSRYLMNINHYALDANGEKRTDGSHGHDKAVRFANYGYSVIKEGEASPSEAVKQSMEFFITQLKEVVQKNPAKKHSTKRNTKKT